MSIFTCKDFKLNFEKNHVDNLYFGMVHHCANFHYVCTVLCRYADRTVFFNSRYWLSITLDFCVTTCSFLKYSFCHNDILHATANFGIPAAVNAEILSEMINTSSS